MEGGWRLADLLAVAAGELLADVGDHLPLPGDHLQGLGDVLAQLGQTRPAAGGAGAGPGNDDPLARQVLGEGLPGRALALKGYDLGGLGGGDLRGQLVLTSRGFQLLELQLELIQDPIRPLRGGAEPLALELGDLQLQMGDQRLIISALGLDRGGFSDSYGRIGARQITIGMRRIQLGPHAGQRRL